MKTAILAAVGLMTISSAFAGPVHNVCDKQIKEYVSSRFGTNVTHIWYGNGTDIGKPVTAWVTVESCSGYYVFYLHASKQTCDQAHFGRIPNYIQTVYAEGACAGKTTEPVENINVCEDQIHAYVESRLGTTATQISIVNKNSDRSTASEAWVKTPECDGYFVFELRTSAEGCTSKHVGRVPNYITRVWEYGACRTGHIQSPIAETPSCEPGFHSVPHYNERFEFEGFVCEKNEIDRTE